MIHIRCGDDILDSLRALRAGPAVKWCDPLCQGPTPAGHSRAAWQEIRARFIAAYGVPLAGVRRDQRRENAALHAALAHDEIVLWFEADLFDQIILVRLLAWFAARDVDGSRLSLVCIGDHPDVERFVGLGQLSASQIAALFPQRRKVTAAQFSLARRAWDAWRTPDRTALDTLRTDDTAALPFLAETIDRHLANLPDDADGLALTERITLEGLSRSDHTAATLFRHLYDTDRRPWLGDLMYWRELDMMAAKPAPLIRIDGPPGWRRGPEGARQTQVAMTPHGDAVLSGKTRHTSPPRWVGGIRVG